MLPISMTGSIWSRPPQFGARVARLDHVQMSAKVAGSRASPHAGQMPACAVGPRDPGALAQRLVGHDAADRAAADADRADRAGLRAERRLDLVRRAPRACAAPSTFPSFSSCRRRSPRTRASTELAVVGHHQHGLAGQSGVDPEEAASPSIVVTPGVGDLVTGACGGDAAPVGAPRPPSRHSPRSRSSRSSATRSSPAWRRRHVLVGHGPAHHARCRTRPCRRCSPQRRKMRS